MKLSCLITCWLLFSSACNNKIKPDREDGSLIADVSGDALLTDHDFQTETDGGLLELWDLDTGTDGFWEPESDFETDNLSEPDRTPPKKVCRIDLIQLTDNQVEDESLTTQDGSVAWLQRGSSNTPPDKDNEIIYWDQTSQPTQLTQDAYFQYTPDTAGHRVVWKEEPSARQIRIMLWEKDNLILIAEGQAELRWAKVSPDMVLMGIGFEANASLYSWIDGVTQRIHPESLAADFPSIDGYRVLFVGSYQASDFDKYELFLSADGQLTQITNNQIMDHEPALKGPIMVWSQTDRTNHLSQVVMKLPDRTEYLSDPKLYCGHPSTDGTVVAWSCESTNHYTLFWRTPAGAIEQLTSESISVLEFQVDDGMVAWVQWDSEWPEPGGSIWLYDGTATMQVASFVHSPEIPGLHIYFGFHHNLMVWRAFDGQDSEVWAAKVIPCEASHKSLRN